METGGKTIKEKLFIEPIILDNISENDPVMQEEIFAHILPVLEFESLEFVRVDKNTKAKRKTIEPVFFQ